VVREREKTNWGKSIWGTQPSSERGHHRLGFDEEF